MRSSVKIGLRRTKDKQGKNRIVIRVYLNGKSTEFATNHSVNESLFDKSKQIVKSKHPRASKINKDITKDKRKIEDIIFDLGSKNSNFSIKELKDHFHDDHIDKSVVANLLQDHIHKNPDDLSYSTLIQYEITHTKWNEIYPQITLDELSTEHLIGFREYLKSEYNNAPNTIYNRLKPLKKVIGLAFNEGLIKENPFRGLRIKKVEGSRDYLNEKELKLLENHKPKNTQEELAKDVFLFSCYTGLRISDICELNSNSFKESDGKVRMQIKLQKGKNIHEIPLSDRAKNIYYKYLEHKLLYLFPLLKQKYSDHKTLLRKRDAANSRIRNKLKDIAASLKLNKNLSMHVGRHTFAVLSITKGSDIYPISKLLGHSNVKVTEIYAKLVDKRKDETIDLWN